MTTTTLADRLAALCATDDMQQDLAAIIDACELSQPAAEVLSTIVGQKMRSLHQLATVLADPQDADQLYRSLAAFWLELRFEWERHNTVSNFSLATTGAALPEVMAAGAAASQLCAKLDDLLDGDMMQLLVDQTCRLLNELQPELAAGAVVPPASLT